MGDRRNVILHYDHERAVTIYAHNGGTKLIETVQDALRRGRSRWTDRAYLARIVFSEVIKDDVLGTAGFGLFPGAGLDDDNPAINVYLHTSRVFINGLSWSFEDFIKTDEELSRASSCTTRLQ